MRDRAAERGEAQFEEAAKISATVPVGFSAMPVNSGDG
jgi:hypothetical protein